MTRGGFVGDETHVLLEQGAREGRQARALRRDPEVAQTDICFESHPPCAPPYGFAELLTDLFLRRLRCLQDFPRGYF